ncbi:hypothetical protein [Entomomonas asaccharolytica]|uniref:Uncharacterized protein n=1 Tax=Entomomonas asaccharolytica TaxID=2785331 RepID=A0A974NET3_9GAMM|nr:hypothetical protein [Entomomonas asaccharolytica]QQP85097.1 hypothetical protein JHT90_11985 [Entomomonas asaccharolytica]
MFDLVKAAEISVLQAKVVQQEPRLRPYFEYGFGSVSASIKNSKGHVLMNLYVSEDTENAQREIDHYHQKLLLMLMP